jgi:DNA (cytosine-5)-methyltransferase 1
MNVVSLFSGVGGFDLGFMQAGHSVVWANDIWKEATETYKKNFPSHIVCQDIKDISASEIPHGDIIIGGFPCQGFSVANLKRTQHDERNYLYLEFVRIVREKSPQYFLAENVKGILSLAKGAVFQMIIRDFTELGYEVQYAILNAADYGVPQTRERVFILGIRNGAVHTPIFPPPPSHQKLNGIPLFEGRLPWISVGEALKNIPEPNDNHNLKNHEASQYKLRFNGYLGHRVINPNTPFPTITSRGDEKGGVVVPHHPNNHRRISAREAAIIQSFPIDFEFVGTKTSVYRQVSNAVPPKLAFAIAKSFPQM